MIKVDLQKKIEEVCVSLGIERKVTLEHPQELTHGDFATSIALSAAKDLKQNPKELAEVVAGKIRELNDESIQEVSVAGPGFINISLTQKALFEELSRVLENGEKYGQNKLNYKNFNDQFSVVKRACLSRFKLLLKNQIDFLKCKILTGNCSKS